VTGPPPVPLRGTSDEMLQALGAAVDPEVLHSTDPVGIVARLITFPLIEMPLPATS